MGNCLDRLECRWVGEVECANFKAKVIARKNGHWQTKCEYVTVFADVYVLTRERGGDRRLREN
jgi:hypothetical protein